MQKREASRRLLASDSSRRGGGGELKRAQSLHCDGERIRGWGGEEWVGDREWLWESEEEQSKHAEEEKQSKEKKKKGKKNAASHSPSRAHIDILLSLSSPPLPSLLWMSAPNSSSSSSAWSRTAVTAAIAIPGALLASAAGLLYLQFSKEKQQVKLKKAAKQAAAAKAPSSAATASSSSSSSSSSASAAAPAVAATPVEILLDQILRDVAARQRNVVDPKREARIWAIIRALDDGSEETLASIDVSARSDIGEWIILAHSATSPLLDGVPTFTVEEGAKASEADAINKENARALAEFRLVEKDYQFAWKLIYSSLTELNKRGEFASLAPKDQSMLVGLELILLDLAHKMRAKEEMVSMYDQVRARHIDAILASANPSKDGKGMSTLAAPSASDEKLFTLWMLSPLLGRWDDFLCLSDIVEKKGQSLTEFHHLAVQRPDILDFRQLNRMLHAAAEESPKVEWVRPRAKDLVWSVSHITAMAWEFKSSNGEDTESIAAFCAGKRPYNSWTPIPLSANTTFRSLGGAIRIRSMITNQMPVCGPYVQHEPSKVFQAQGAVLFRTQAQGDAKPSRLLQLREEYKNFRRVDDIKEIESIVRKNQKKEILPPVPTAVAAKAAAEGDAEKKEEASEDAAAASTAAAESTDATATPAASTSTDDAAAPAADSTDASSSSASSSSSAPSAPSVDPSSPLPLSEFDPANPPEIWVGTYVFGQYAVAEDESTDTGYQVAVEPFMQVEFELALRMKQLIKRA